MATKIENLATTLELIRANSQAAEREAKNWQDFVLRMTSRYPEIQIIDSQEEFSAWASGHSELNIDPSIFKGKEIIEAYFYLREQKEVQNAPKAPMEINPQLNALGMMGLPALAIIFRDTPKILEADKDYQKIIASKKTEWQEKNPGKNLLESEEELNYLYGDPNDPDKKTMDDEAEEKFRELAKTNNIVAKRLEKYDLEKQKIYKNPNNDSSLMHLSAKINEEAQARISLFKKNKKNVTDEELKKTFLKLEEKNYLIFARKNEAKANAYALFDERLKKALQKIPKKEIAKEKEEEEEKKEKKEDQISPGQVRRLAEELQKEQKAAEISNIRKPIPGQRPPVSQSPMTRPTAPGFTQRPSIPKINLGGLGREAGQGLGRAGGLLGRGGGLAARGGTMAIGALAGLGWPVIVGIAAVLLFTIIIIIIGGGMGSQTPGVEAGGDISTCLFTRSDQNPKETSFKSQKLLDYINNAAIKSTVPNTVLAAFIRVESPGSTNLSDSQIDGFCPESEDGALGIMQLIPHFSHRTDAICLDCLKNGAKLLNTNVESLTRADYCSPQKSLILGSGFILKKMQYLGYGDGTRWDPNWTNDLNAMRALAKAYYGCFKYPTCEDSQTGLGGGPYDYGQDLYTSVTSCKINSGPISIPPAPQDTQSLRSAIESNFNIVFDSSFSDQFLRWSWDVLWQAKIKAPKFFPLINQKIRIFPGSGGVRIGDIIYLSSTMLSNPNQDFYKQNLIHELGHVIHGQRGASLYDQQLSSIIRTEGYLTAYSKQSTPQDGVICNPNADPNNPLVIDTRVDEDFSESVSYFINDQTTEQNYSYSQCTNPPILNSGQNPFKTGRYSVHLKFIKEVLGGN